MWPANTLGEVKMLGPIALAALAMPQELCPSPSLAGCRASQHRADLHPRSSGPPGTEDRPAVSPDGQDGQPQRQAAPHGQEVAQSSPFPADRERWAPAPLPGSPAVATDRGK